MTGSLYVDTYRREVERLFQNASQTENVDLDDLKNKIKIAYEQCRKHCSHLDENHPTIQELTGNRNFYIKTAEVRLEKLRSLQRKSGEPPFIDKV